MCSSSDCFLCCGGVFPLFFLLLSFPCISGLFGSLFFLWSALTARNKITHDWQPAAWSENSHLSHSVASCQVRYAKPCFRKFQYCQVLLAANVFHSSVLEGKKYLSFSGFLLEERKKKRRKKKKGGEKRRKFIRDEILKTPIFSSCIGR